MSDDFKMLTTPEQITEISYPNFTPRQRRIWLAYTLMGNPVKITNQELAKKFKISEPTISNDLRSDEFEATCDEVIRRFVRTDLVLSAMKNVAKSIYGGNVKDSQWLLEHVFPDILHPESSSNGMSQLAANLRRAADAADILSGTIIDGESTDVIESPLALESTIETPDAETS